MKPISNKFWHDLNAERYHWAEKCYATFLRQCDADRLIQTRGEVARQVSIIVYGPTQVGKTSLILTLLGVKESCFEEVSRILRGGQTLGNSATACTYRYRIAEDDSWYFSHLAHGLQRYSDEQATAVFSEIRQQMEHSHGHFSSIDIFIPARFFPTNNTQATQYIIRDLPGIHAANEVEREYVSVLMGQYLSSADVILLAGTVDSLGFLKPEAQEHDVARDWLWQPHRYKIMLTRSYSNASVHALLQKGELKTPLDIRNYLLQQINTLDVMLPDAFKTQLFPVECGHSWLHIQKGDAGYAQLCRQLRDDFLAELQAQLTQATNPLARLRSGFTLPYFLGKQMEHLQGIFYADKCALDASQERKLGQIKAANDRLTKIQERLRSGLQTETLSSRFTDFSFPTIPIIPDKSDQTVDVLKTCLEQTSEHLRDAWRKWAIDNALTTDIQPGLFRTDNIDRLHSQLAGYYLNRYWSKENYAKDKTRVSEAIRSDIGILMTSAQKHIMVATEHYEQGILRRVRRLQRAEHRLNRIIEYWRKEVERLQCQIDTLTDEYAAQHALCVSQLTSSRRFKEVIEMAKTERAQQLKAQFTQAQASRDERVALILAAKMLEKDYRYIKMLGEGE
ncbi:hypothetical protein [Kosakonia oryzendophytica]|uniref:hypothetical protein n=1 Tax=Kosakonia TaxID=1330547 RepID=UPI000776FBFB|nr:hypothetical protein [Kosakonia oryzendophytica]TDT59662.1 hypothetical protein DFO53_1251 [Enterobacter sp. AG5470]WBT56108.1 hypothetical protein O9K67_12945 [Kosakonia oryzendophytica]